MTGPSASPAGDASSGSLGGPACLACPGEEELVELATGLLASDPLRSNALHAHVDGCATCGLLLADLLLAAGSEVETGSALVPGAAPAPGPSVRPGNRLGRYLLLEELGRGGMGVVCAAFDPQLDRRVALKRVRPGAPGAGTPREACARLLSEAQALARLSHPNVITVFDAQLITPPGLIDGDGAELFVAMELLPGRTLRDLLAAERSEPPSARTLLARFLEAGEGLCAAHAAGLVHGDFKPENALLGEDGRVRVADFGLAREAGEGVQGAVSGTPAYLAPEQWLGQPADARSDQFAFCVALWEALAGARPFSGATRETLLSQISRGPSAEAAGRLPPRLRRLLLRGLAFEPAGRHASLRVLLDALAPLSADLGPRRPAHVALAGGAAGAVAGTALLAAFAWSGGLSTTRARTVRAEPQTLAEAAVSTEPEVASSEQRHAPGPTLPAAPPLAQARAEEAGSPPAAAQILPADGPPAQVLPDGTSAQRPAAPVAKAAPGEVAAAAGQLDEEATLAAEAAGRASNGDPQGAVALHRRLLSLREQRHGPHALSAAHARLDLGLDLIALGDVEAGRAEVRAALAALSRGFFSREPEVFASELRALDGPRHPAATPGEGLKAAPGRPTAPSDGAPGFAFPEGDEPVPGARTVR